jgi:hypothetical protein
MNVIEKSPVGAMALRWMSSLRDLKRLSNYSEKNALEYARQFSLDKAVNHFRNF